jgi:hypothetical protein
MPYKAKIEEPEESRSKQEKKYPAEGIPERKPA